MTRLMLPAALATLLLLGGCVVENTAPAPSYPPVPAPLAEQTPLPPVSGELQIYQPGHWDWDGRGYVWQHGAWVPRAGHGSLWQDGFWSLTGGRWVWVPGHWT